ncbi:uncharacterized protein LOC115062079 [Echeneis naucrates]|uniref:uncharacterized protein LOC115062079 n=1 Tax=Echeneis naucrates TaxID=173247 RepID=UPI001113CE6B|nr:uncharacterized protein LOC115062079 [Echeneis naucrates]
MHNLRVGGACVSGSSAERDVRADGAAERGGRRTPTAGSVSEPRRRRRRPGGFICPFSQSVRRTPVSHRRTVCACVSVRGCEDLPVHLERCCNPSLADGPRVCPGRVTGGRPPTGGVPHCYVRLLRAGGWGVRYREAAGKAGPNRWTPQTGLLTPHPPYRGPIHRLTLRYAAVFLPRRAGVPVVVVGAGRGSTEGGDSGDCEPALRNSPPTALPLTTPAVW